MCCRKFLSLIRKISPNFVIAFQKMAAICTYLKLICFISKAYGRQMQINGQDLEDYNSPTLVSRVITSMFSAKVQEEDLFKAKSKSLSEPYDKPRCLSVASRVLTSMLPKYQNSKV